MSARSAILLTGNVLCHNPRVVKEADALSDAGWRVHVLGGWMDGVLASRDRELVADRAWTFTPVVDLTRTPARPSRQWLRVRSRAGRFAGEWCGLQNHWQLGYAAPELLAAARESRADLFIAHSEQALWVAARLAEEGRRVGIDMEDWFSRDLPIDGRAGRAVTLLTSLEKTLLRGAAYRSCPSQAMSQTLAVEYDCPRPAVVYNAFPWSDRRTMDGLTRDRVSHARPSIHWYSQTLGAGRGLEDLVAALAYLSHDAEIHLRGKVSQAFDAWLHSNLPTPWRDRVFVHPPVAHGELLSRIAEHDIGFAGETRTVPSRDLTVTNKLLHYLLGGLAVVASDTMGQREIAAGAPGAVFLYPCGDPQALAATLSALLADRSRLAEGKRRALQAAEERVLLGTSVSCDRGLGERGNVRGVRGVILFGHPSGGPFSHQAALAHLEAGRLDAFCVPWMPTPWQLALLSRVPGGSARVARLARRSFPPLLEAPRVEGRLGEWWRLMQRSRVDPGNERLSYQANDWLMRTMRRECRRRSVTAVHSYEDCSALPFVEASRQGKACIYDLPIGYYPAWQETEAALARCYIDWLPPGGLPSSQFARPQQKLQEMELASVVLVPSTFVQETVGRFVEQKAVALAPYGVDANFWQPPPGPKCASDVFRFIYAGQCSVRKGIPFLLEAWRAADLKGAELELVGSWQLAPERLKDLPPGVRFTGPVSSQALRARYHAADVFLLPSFFEGFGLVLLEAMASGLPAIATEATAAPDILDESCGQVIAAGDKDALIESLRWFLRNRDRLEEMGTAARERAVASTWERYRRHVQAAVASFS